MHSCEYAGPGAAVHPARMGCSPGAAAALGGIPTNAVVPTAIANENYRPSRFRKVPKPPRNSCPMRTHEATAVGRHHRERHTGGASSPRGGSLEERSACRGMGTPRDRDLSEDSRTVRPSRSSKADPYVEVVDFRPSSSQRLSRRGTRPRPLKPEREQEDLEHTTSRDLAPPTGLEPVTLRLTAACSAN